MFIAYRSSKKNVEFKLEFKLVRNDRKDHVKVFECLPNSEYLISTSISTFREKLRFFEFTLDISENIKIRGKGTHSSLDLFEKLFL